MKIAIQVEEKSMESKISKVFGRCPYFLIIDDKDLNDYKFVENLGLTSQGGAGIKAAQVIVDNNVDVLITDHLGENAIEVLKQLENIKVYKYIDSSINENLKLLKENKLEEVNI